MDDGVAAAPPPAAAAAAALDIISLVWIGAGMLPRSFIVGCVLSIYLSLIKVWYQAQAALSSKFGDFHFL